MKLPESPRSLPGGLVCPDNDVERRVWQAHLLKHPLGVGALIEHDGAEPWNYEGWDTLEPPVITQARRDSIVKAITALQGSSECRLPELRGRTESDPERLPCYDCARNAFRTCETVFSSGEAPVVAQEYLRVTLELLASVDSARGEIVPRGEFTRRALSLWWTPEAFAGLTVAQVGTLWGGKPLLWITRFDGVESQYYLEGKKLRWKTTYRVKLPTATSQLSFLVKTKNPIAQAGDLSDKCIVPRQWWENHEH